MPTKNSTTAFLESGPTQIDTFGRSSTIEHLFFFMEFNMNEALSVVMLGAGGEIGQQVSAQLLVMPQI